MIYVYPYVCACSISENSIPLRGTGSLQDTEGRRAPTSGEKVVNETWQYRL